MRTKSSWYEAYDICKANNGDLAGVPDEEVNNFLREYIPSGLADDYCWLGGYEKNEGSWAWDDGHPWLYSNWQDGQPNTNPANTEDCLAMITWSSPDNSQEPGLWDDMDCSLEMAFICSKSK